MIAALLSALLAEKKISRRELARRVGVSAITASSWCAGTHNPRTDQLEKIASAIGVPVARLLEAGSKSGNPALTPDQHEQATIEAFMDIWHLLSREDQEAMLYQITRELIRSGGDGTGHKTKGNGQRKCGTDGR